MTPRTVCDGDDARERGVGIPIGPAMMTLWPRGFAKAIALVQAVSFA